MVRKSVTTRGALNLQSLVENPKKWSAEYPNLHTNLFELKDEQGNTLEALILGHVNQINIFSKGHHGYSYFPTKIGTMHPNLDFDLLSARIEACHEIGVVCPIYFTVGWRALDAYKHPKWMIRHKQGNPGTTNLDLDDKEAVEQSYALGMKAHMKELRELEAKYHLGQGSPVVAMSGKFHKVWGKFGGFKHPDAIKYEAAAMISFGATYNFGDQLHPSGEMELETYRNIGEAYQYVEQIEDYGPGGIPVSKLGLWLTLDHAADHGVVNMLLQLHHDFIVANEKNMDELDLLIVPEHAFLSPEQADQINSWVKDGGKLIVFGEGALNPEKTAFLRDYLLVKKPADSARQYRVSLWHHEPDQIRVVE